MSDQILDFLERHGGSELELSHHGVKGMKWGARRNRKGRVKARATMSRRDRKDSEWLDDPTKHKGKAFSEAYNKVHRASASRVRQGIRAINNKPEYKKQDFREDSPLRKKYYDEISRMVETQINASAKTHGVSPGKRFEMNFTVDIDKMVKPKVHMRMRDTRRSSGNATVAAKESIREIKRSNKLSHADTDSGEWFEVPVSFDDQWHVSDISVMSMSHEVVDDYLEHHGIKGMKWGVRRSEKQLTRAASKRDGSSDDSSGSSSGGSSSQTKTSTNDPSSWTDAELRQRLQRVQMERQYANLTAPTPEAKTFMRQTLEDTGKELAKSYIKKGAQKGAEKLEEYLMGKVTGGELKDAPSVSDISKVGEAVKEAVEPKYKPRYVDPIPFLAKMSDTDRNRFFNGGVDPKPNPAGFSMTPSQRKQADKAVRNFNKKNKFF